MNEGDTVFFIDTNLLVWNAKRLACRELWSEDLAPGQQYHDVLVVNPIGSYTVVDGTVN